MVRTKISARSNTTNSSVCVTDTSLMYIPISLGVGSVMILVPFSFSQKPFLPSPEK